jgi:hypothetical protein
VRAGRASEPIRKIGTATSSSLWTAGRGLSPLPTRRPGGLFGPCAPARVPAPPRSRGPGHLRRRLSRVLSAAQQSNRASVHAMASPGGAVPPGAASGACPTCVARGMGGSTV